MLHNPGNVAIAGTLRLARRMTSWNIVLVVAVDLLMGSVLNVNRKQCLTLVQFAGHTSWLGCLLTGRWGVYGCGGGGGAVVVPFIFKWGAPSQRNHTPPNYL